MFGAYANVSKSMLESVMFVLGKIVTKETLLDADGKVYCVKLYR